MINLETIASSSVCREPFEFFLAKGVLSDRELETVTTDFPAIDKPGVYPLSALAYGPAFAQLIDDLESPQLAKIVGDKLGVDLSGLPLMITVRGQAQAKDGRIHTDTQDKVVTCLLYLNDRWENGGGRLRLLRDGKNLDNYVTEIPPNGGVLAAFKVGRNSWHGHKPFIGRRRYIMFNWLRSGAALNRQIGRHKLSAQLKRFLPF
jgi:SM-20-related protein